MWKANKYISSSILATRWVEDVDKPVEHGVPEPKVSPSAEWTCASCTFVNSKDNIKCDMCNADYRPPPREDVEVGVNSRSCQSKPTLNVLIMQEPTETDLDEEGREANDIHFVVGDVTKPIVSKQVGALWCGSCSTF